MGGVGSVNSALYRKRLTQLTSGPQYRQTSALGAGEMAQWVKHLLYKREDLDLDP